MNFKFALMILISISINAGALECPLSEDLFGQRPGETTLLVCTSAGGTIERDGHLVFLPKTLCIFKSGPEETFAFRMATPEKTLEFDQNEVLRDDVKIGILSLHKSEKVYPSGDIVQSYTIENSFDLFTEKGFSSGLHSYSNHSPAPYSYTQSFDCER